MQIINTIREMQAVSEKLRLAGKRIGVVPTMGYLHRGHASLIEHAKKLSDVIVTTIFVNPTQFAPNEDFEKYPRDFEHDRSVAQEAGSEIIFHPDVTEMYPTGYGTIVEIEAVSKILEGKFRPTHFRGVTTVVAKLFNIVKPHVAVLGQKDAQQAFIIQQMVRDLNLDLSVLIAPIVREADGLALSSRNVYLGAEDRKNATVLYRSLKHAEKRIGEGARSSASLRKEMEQIIQSGHPTQIDYIAFIRLDSFEEIETIGASSVLIALAVRFGSTRLIDNITVNVH